MSTKKKGFGALSPERHREIARLGGCAAHAQGVAHEFSSEEAKAAGKKGGLVTGSDVGHMAEIGRRGGKQRALNRQKEGRAS